MDKSGFLLDYSVKKKSERMKREEISIWAAKISTGHEHKVQGQFFLVLVRMYFALTIFAYIHIYFNCIFNVFLWDRNLKHIYY